MAALQSNLICIAALLLSAVNQSYAFALPALDDTFGSPLLDARASNNNTHKSSTAKKLAKGAIIGIAVGVAVFVLIVVALIVCCCMRRRKSKKAREIAT
ncbi:unnamed protein product [Clonostachys byssicola]|uniref:Transmembrane protein n=1 Tax=Clonostachys byssicola TaxID=160290 RepID=A0A9N9U2S8_9HYPO|nr:unnamed protein product [Clonostachys byssicola]